jgi:hypothetical protein
MKTAGHTTPKITLGRRWLLPLIAALLALILVGCAAGPNALIGHTPDPAGFWMGLWHGLISPITFLISLFRSDINIYEVANNGNWYDFGFILGVFLIFSGPAGGGMARGRRVR